MTFNYFHKKYALLFFYTNQLKKAGIKNYKVLITTPFGAVKGIPDFTIPTSRKVDFFECVNNNNYLINNYLELAEQDHERIKNSKYIELDNECFFPLIKDDEYIVINDAVVYSNGTTFEVPSFTLFSDSILGISFVS
ncbi:MAG: hypothetical protein ACLVH8_06035 [Fusobacterium sp.]